MDPPTSPQNHHILKEPPSVLQLCETHHLQELVSQHNDTYSTRPFLPCSVRKRIVRAGQDRPELHVSSSTEREGTLSSAVRLTRLLPDLGGGAQAPDVHRQRADVRAPDEVPARDEHHVNSRAVTVSRADGLASLRITDDSAPCLLSQERTRFT